MNEDVKTIAVVVASLITFAAAVITFVNGRLNEAKSDDARARVFGWLIAGASLAANFAGVILVVFTPWILIPVICFTLSVLINLAVFIFGSGTPSRWEIAGLVVNVSLCLSTWVMFLLFSFVRALKP